MSVLLVALKFALSWLANVEVVTTMIVAFTLLFGLRRSLVAVNVFCLLDMLIYSFFLPVAVSYFFHYNLVAAAVKLVHMLTKRTDSYIYALLVMVLTVGFGFETTLADYLFLGLPFWPRYISGLLFFAIHIFSVTVITLAALPALVKVGQKLRPG